MQTDVILWCSLFSLELGKKLFLQYICLVPEVAEKRQMSLAYRFGLSVNVLCSTDGSARSKTLA